MKMHSKTLAIGFVAAAKIFAAGAVATYAENTETENTGAQVTVDSSYLLRMQL